MRLNRTLGLSGTVAVSVLLVTWLFVFGADDADSLQSLPLAEAAYVLGDDIAAYRAFMMSGGPPPDGIPSIDNPHFVNAAEARLDPDDMVIGYYRGGEARASPHRIMVYHEIVNDRIDGVNVAITYCPLTATAQGFERGGATLGVSGQLLNSNLVMFDRDSGTLFSQIAATGVRGRYDGRTLVEVSLIWTTWARWRARYPDTRVLSENTGHLRNYNRDPYGTYNPLGGYYRQDATIFPLMHSSSRQRSKDMVVGGRTAARSVSFVMADLRRVRIQRTAGFLAVYDARLDTGYIYLRGDGTPNVTARADGRYQLGDRVVAADELPLERLVSVKAFHFAWHAFYPASEFAAADSR
jgi:hypothetical protein